MHEYTHIYIYSTKITTNMLHRTNTIVTIICMLHITYYIYPFILDNKYSHNDIYIFDNILDLLTMIHRQKCEVNFCRSLAKRILFPNAMIDVLNLMFFDDLF